MPNKDEQYRAHVYFGKEIHDIIQDYARVQGVTYGTIARRLCYMSLYNELTQRYGGDFKPNERKKDWNK